MNGTVVKEHDPGTRQEIARTAPLKIGGWLIVVAIGLIISLLQSVPRMSEAVGPKQRLDLRHWKEALII